MRLVEPPQQRQAVALGLGCDVLQGGGRTQVRDGLRAAGVDDRALMRHRQEAGTEVALLIVRQPLRVGQHHERREVVRLATERIADPRTETREAWQQEARVHQVASGTMDVRPRHHRHQERHVVHAHGQMRQQAAHPATALSALPELKGRLEHSARLAGGRLDAFVCARVELLPVALDQFRFVIEQIDLAGAAVHE